MGNSELNLIADDFQHGANFQIGNFCTIEEGCVVGDNVKIGSYVYLKRGTVVGNDVFLDSYVKSSGQNRIGSHVTIRFNATIAREVTIEDEVFVSPNVMTIYSTHLQEKKGGTTIGRHAFIGTNAVIGPNVQIAPRAVIGAMSLVTSDCLVPGTYLGVPAKAVEAR